MNRHGVTAAFDKRVLFVDLAAVKVNGCVWVCVTTDDQSQDDDHVPAS